MIVLAGASASGKTEVAKLLAKKYGITKMITTTTREKRIGEEDGRDYFFITKKEFESRIRRGKFVEYTIFNGNYYGSGRDQIADDRCIVIDPAGLRSFIALKNPTVLTFYLEADEETRHSRMLSRGDDLQKIEERIMNDREIFVEDILPKTDYYIKADNSRSIEEIADEIYQKYLNFINKK